MLKQLELSSPSSCLNKAADDEQVFVLRAKDVHAPMTIRHWVSMSRGFQKEEKLTAALLIADEMERWYNQNFPSAGHGSV